MSLLRKLAGLVSVRDRGTQTNGVGGQGKQQVRYVCSGRTRCPSPDYGARNDGMGAKVGLWSFTKCIYPTYNTEHRDNSGAVEHGNR